MAESDKLCRKRKSFLPFSLRDTSDGTFVSWFFNYFEMSMSSSAHSLYRHSHSNLQRSCNTWSAELHGVTQSVNKFNWFIWLALFVRTLKIAVANYAQVYRCVPLIGNLEFVKLSESRNCMFLWNANYMYL